MKYLLLYHITHGYQPRFSPFLFDQRSLHIVLIARQDLFDGDINP